jgi:diazepam-binding inhibitor (GABA receptor modulating acyl-CoA-binding protein)
MIKLILVTLCAFLQQGVLGHPEFRKCANFVKSASPASVTDDVKLRVYSLYKQATEGNCPKERVSAVSGIRKLKLQSWCSLCGMPADRAEDEYVRLIDSMVPRWRSDAH